MVKSMVSSCKVQARPQEQGRANSFFSPKQLNAVSNVFFQPKLSIGPTDDVYEREADVVADKVMRMNSHEQIQTKVSPVNIQTKCAACEEEQVQRKEDEMKDEQSEAPRKVSDTLELAGSPSDSEPQGSKSIPHVQRRCAACEEDELVQREEGEADDEQSEAPSIVSDALGSGGNPLDNNSRASMESRFGYDFSKVKIHTDSLAAKSAKSINALAYTSGNNIVFGSGQYSTHSEGGKRLLAHELTHVVQQQHAPALAIQRHDDDDDSGFHRVDELPELPPPVACSGGTNDPCQISSCEGRHDSIRDDFTRALAYATAAFEALDVNPLSDYTIQTLDLFFRDHSDSTVSAVQETMHCVVQCLTAAFEGDQYGCDLDYPEFAAYVCVGSTPLCTDHVTNICFTERYFLGGDRFRAEALIHECGHRIGLSLGGPAFDVYPSHERFPELSTAEALMNTSSFARFAGTIANVSGSGAFTGTLPFGVSLGGGAALSGGTDTWYARLNMLNIEFQHPVLQIFNPFLGLSLMLIGDSTSRTDPDETASVSYLNSLIAGFRVAAPRSGPDGGGYFSFWGGPALVVSEGRVDVGAEAGVALGYRWNWFDASVGATYVHDPTRPEGMQDVTALGASVSLTFEPLVLPIP